jgi:prepilin-type N-terminal cleavage/methylation domain-containing protein
MCHLAMTRRGRRRREAFTLVELLVVMAIIAVLASLSLAVTVSLIQTQHERSTKFTIRQVNGELKKHWDEVVNQAKANTNWKKDDVNGLIQQWSNQDDKLGHVMYVKFRLKQEFPTSFAEALNPYPLAAKTDYVTYLKNFGITTTTNPPTAIPAAHESAACLYMALSVTHGGTKTNLDQLNVGVKTFDTPGGQPIKALTDDWANPLLFCRWPTGDATLDALTPLQNTKIRDLQDPDGLLLNSTWYGTAVNPGAGRVAFEKYGHSLTKNNNAGVPAAHAYYLIPTIVSSGRDGKFGLDATEATTSAADAKDNLYSYQIDRE